VTWDLFGTLAKTLWIGGGQWAGKSTVANTIAERYGITAYHYDYPSARSHWDRCVAAAGGSRPPNTAENRYIEMTPTESAASALALLHQCFEYALDDLRALVSGRPILAEGWGLRPELVAPILPSTDRMIVIIPTDEFRAYQSRHLERATRPHGEVSDLVLAQRNRLERDRLVARDAVAHARRLGIRVLEVDGSAGVEATVEIVADHFGAYLR
jgi:hypothetical protein